MHLTVPGKSYQLCTTAGRVLVASYVHKLVVCLHRSMLTNMDTRGGFRISSRDIFRGWQKSPRGWRKKFTLSVFHAPLSDHFCCLGRVPYGIRRYSTSWYGTVQLQTSGRYNKAGMLLSQNGTKIGTVHDFSLYRTARCSALHCPRLMCTV